MVVKLVVYLVGRWFGLEGSYKYKYKGNKVSARVRFVLREEE